MTFVEIKRNCLFALRVPPGNSRRIMKLFGARAVCKGTTVMLVPQARCSTLVLPERTCATFPQCSPVVVNWHSQYCLLAVLGAHLLYRLPDVQDHAVQGIIAHKVQFPIPRRTVEQAITAQRGLQLGCPWKIAIAALEAAPKGCTQSSCVYSSRQWSQITPPPKVQHM